MLLPIVVMALLVGSCGAVGHSEVGVGVPASVYERLERLAYTTEAALNTHNSALLIGRVLASEIRFGH